MSKNWARLLRYSLLTVVLAPFFLGAFFVIDFASAIGNLPYQDTRYVPPRTSSQSVLDALARVSDRVLLAMVCFPCGRKSIESVIANSVFWASALSASIALLRSLLRRRRIPNGYCQNCGYNLTGNVSGVCPECGEKI